MFFFLINWGNICTQIISVVAWNQANCSSIFDSCPEQLVLHYVTRIERVQSSARSVWCYTALCHTPPAAVLQLAMRDWREQDRTVRGNQGVICAICGAKVNSICFGNGKNLVALYGKMVVLVEADRRTDFLLFNQNHHLSSSVLIA